MAPFAVRGEDLGAEFRGTPAGLSGSADSALDPVIREFWSQDEQSDDQPEGVDHADFRYPGGGIPVEAGWRLPMARADPARRISTGKE